jgi:hypothetical protein
MEFITILAFFVFVTTFYSAYFMFEWSEITVSNRQAEVGLFLHRISAYIDVAYLGGPGFTASFYLPDNLYGQNYTIAMNASDKAVELNIGDIQAFSSTITEKFRLVRWNFGGTQTIENVDGTVVIR